MNIPDLLIFRDVGGNPQSTPDCSRLFSNLNQYLTLTASTVNTAVVPTDISNPNAVILAYFKFTLGATVWVLPNSSPTLTLPTSTAALTMAEMNPSGRVVTLGQTLQFITADAGVSVGISYYVVLKG